MKFSEENIKTLDQRNFEAVFKAYFAGLTYFAQKFVYDIDTSKEIVHDVFVKLWEKRNELDLSKSLKSYLFTSVHNRCLNYIRDNKKFDKSDFSENVFNNYAENNDFLIEAEVKAKINSVMQKLPEKCRQIFEMNRFEGKKYHEIAQELDISIKTVEAQMSKALRIFREDLKEYLPIYLILLFLMYKY